MKKNNGKLKNFFYVRKPWGRFIEFLQNQKATVKILEINPGGALSLQCHKLREEFWYVIAGKPQVIVGNKKKILKAGDHIYIFRKQKHRIINQSQTKIKVLELSFGEFKEDDEMILEDKYGRKRGL